MQSVELTTAIRDLRSDGFDCIAPIIKKWPELEGIKENAVVKTLGPLLHFIEIGDVNEDDHESYINESYSSLSAEPIVVTAKTKQTRSKTNKGRINADLWLNAVDEWIDVQIITNNPKINKRRPNLSDGIDLSYALDELRKINKDLEDAVNDQPEYINHPEGPFMERSYIRNKVVYKNLLNGIVEVMNEINERLDAKERPPEPDYYEDVRGKKESTKFVEHAESIQISPKTKAGVVSLLKSKEAIVVNEKNGHLLHLFPMNRGFGIRGRNIYVDQSLSYKIKKPSKFINSYSDGGMIKQLLFGSKREPISGVLRIDKEWKIIFLGD